MGTGKSERTQRYRFRGTINPWGSSDGSINPIISDGIGNTDQDLENIIWAEWRDLTPAMTRYYPGCNRDISSIEDIHSRAS